MRRVIIFLLFFTLLGCCGSHLQSDTKHPCNVTISVFYHKDIKSTSEAKIKLALQGSAQDFKEIANYDFKYPDYSVVASYFGNFKTYNGYILYDGDAMARKLYTVSYPYMVSILFTNDSRFTDENGVMNNDILNYGIHFDSHVIIIFQTDFLYGVKLTEEITGLQAIVEHELGHYFNVQHSKSEQSFMYPTLSIQEHGFDDNDKRQIIARRHWMCD